MRIDNEIAHGFEILKSLDTGRGAIWSWSSPAGRERAKERSDFICSGLTPGMKVVELGCGLGIFSRPLGETGATILSVDVSAALLAKARELTAEKAVHYIAADAMRLPVPDSSVDAVVGVSVLHHLDIDLSLKEILRVLKPKGKIAFSEPNYMNPQITFERSCSWARKVTLTSPDETAFFRWSLKDKLERFGFTDIAISPFDFLHPAVPPKAVPFMKRLSGVLSEMPIVREIAGSLRISARHP